MGEQNEKHYFLTVSYSSLWNGSFTRLEENIVINIPITDFLTILKEKEIKAQLRYDECKLTGAYYNKTLIISFYKEISESDYESLKGALKSPFLQWNINN